MTDRHSAFPDPALPAQSGGTACKTPDPIGLIAEEHALQRELCDLLEAIADGLPHTFDKALALIAVSILEGSVPAHMELEEAALFPLLRERVPPGDPLASALVCLEDEHERDGAALLEMTDTLKTAIAAGAVANPDMLGYMLRGYFDSQRRHIAWEDQLVLPAARSMLTADDLAKIQKWIVDSEHPRCSRQSVKAIRGARAANASICSQCPSSTPAGAVIPFTPKRPSLS